MATWRRKTVDKFEDGEDDRVEDVPLMVNMDKHNSNHNVSCAELLDLNPAKFGPGSKKNNSIWAYLFPCWVQQWKDRYFVLIGSYFFRFESEFGESVKGVPIPLDCITAKNMGNGLFEVSTLRKVYQIRVETEKEAAEWVRLITRRKQDAVRENMGHAPVDAGTKRINKIGAHLFDKRLEIDRLVARYTARDPIDPRNQSEFTM